jgi:hypothetical protein
MPATQFISQMNKLYVIQNKPVITRWLLEELDLCRSLNAKLISNPTAEIIPNIISTRNLNLNLCNTLTEVFNKMLVRRDIYHSKIKCQLTQIESIELEFWQQTSGTCVFSSFLNAYQVKNLEQLGIHLTKIIPFQEQAKYIKMLEDMPKEGVEPDIFLQLSKYMHHLPREVRGVGQFNLPEYLSVDSDAGGHLMVTLTIFRNKTTYQLLFDSNISSGAPCVIQKSKNKQNFTHQGLANKMIGYEVEEKPAKELAIINFQGEYVASFTL